MSDTMSHAKTQDPIEIMAEQLWLIETGVKWEFAGRYKPKFRKRARGLARALAKAGYALAPREPNEEMLRAGAMDVSPRMPPPGDLISEGVRFRTTRDPIVPVLISRNIWRAMVKAAR